MGGVVNLRDRRRVVRHLAVGTRVVICGIASVASWNSWPLRRRADRGHAERYRTRAPSNRRSLLVRIPAIGLCSIAPARGESKDYNGKFHRKPVMQI